MSAIRRTVLVFAVAALTVLTGGAAAWGAFSDSAGSSTTIITNTITAPTGVTATKNSCSNQRWINVTVSWQASPSARISGYAVTAYGNDGQVLPIGTTGPGTTSLGTTLDKLSGTSVTFTVTTTTSYGWSAESPPTTTLSC